MAASSIPDLYTFEEHFEAAAAIFLNGATGLTVYRSNEISDFTTPRISVECEVADAMEPPAQRNGGASPTTLEYVAFNSSFNITIITDNTVGQSSSMVTYVGQVREAMARSQPNWDSTSLPYYDIKELRPTNSSQDADGDLNETILSYSLIFEIRDDAWPA